jgi:hypothetical protein
MPNPILLRYLSIAICFLAVIGVATTVLATQTTQATARPRPPTTCGYCNTHLLNMSLDQISDYVLNILKDLNKTTGEAPKVVLARMVTPDDYQYLGLGCPPDEYNNLIEKPPLAFVLLTGDVGYPTRMHQPPAFKPTYAAFVIDLWSGTFTHKAYSFDGRNFAHILKDPTLPTVEPYTCPPPLLHTPYHYGETAPPIK